MNCQKLQSELQEVALNPAAIPTPALENHLVECPPCRIELTEMRQTMSMMDDWSAPEPTGWFDTRLNARLREEQTAAPAGFFERLRDRLLFNTGAQFRPMMAGALALILVLGGAGGYLEHARSGNMEPMSAAVVNDLQIIDHDDQAIQEMDQLFDDDSPDADESQEI